MKKYDQIELMLIMSVIIAVIPCGITYWISGSILYTLIPLLPILFFSYRYVQNTKCRKEIISIFQNEDTIHLMLGDDNWHTIKTNYSTDIESSIMDKLNSNFEYLISHIKRIDLINIDNKPLQDKLNNLVSA
jgi:hypothetical protein